MDPDIVASIYFPVHLQDPKERVQAYLDAYKEQGPKHDSFDADLMRNIRLVSATAKPSAKIVFEFDVHPRFCSKSNNMHGGAVALMADMGTTMAVAPLSSKDFWHFGGVSRVLSVSYLRPIPKSITLLVKCKVVQIGKTNATIHMKAYNKANNTLLCVAEHSKTWVDIRQRM
ncbi:uncharacterized protein PV09_02007 [Verruconis gallopava]|uniref:Thioesterase domain-containing protein n=1 Tax=Verruconis gallopava TaxID=253628 RepID=A0A0D2AKN9_9PEZI|nr:uncharacterized protein PV09_02007 [Verruconis gallopava]KIW07135.1 hypothetical protein PV09_02007 [Verruconis gallopava]